MAPLGWLAVVPILMLGANLDIAGETSRVVFNAYGQNANPMEMVAQNGQLNLSGVMVAKDVVTMSGTSFNAMMDVVSNLSATVSGLSAELQALRGFVGMVPPSTPPPPSPATPPFVNQLVSWSSPVHSHCQSGAGSLNKVRSGGAWTCAAFTGPSFQVAASGGGRAIEYKCGCTSHRVNVGFMRASNPSWSTWTANIQRTCTSNNDCGYYAAGIQYGFSCRNIGQQLHIHYNNKETFKRVGTFSSSNVLRIELNGNTIRWLRDGSVLHTQTETVDYPQRIFATAHDTGCTSQLNDLRLTT